MKIKLVILGATLLYSASSSYANTLSDFAAKCDAEIGFTVPEIDCDQGTVVPTTINGTTVQVLNAGAASTGNDPTRIVRNTNGTFTPPLKCDRPNVLNGSCDPMSRFQVVSNTPDAYVVAHCRQKGGAPSAYGDIAVIQHNKTTGATCFYQNPVTSFSTVVNNIIKAPSTGSTGASNLVGATGCMSCHDNGALIRTPYLAQIKTGPNVIPGNGSVDFNKTQPYFIVGQEQYERYHVTLGNSGSNCTTCHALSFWRSGPGAPISINSAGHLAVKATALTQLSKLAHSETSPIWMSFSGPGSIAYDPAANTAALNYQACANRFTSEGLVNSDTCKIVKAPGKKAASVTLVSRAGKCVDINANDYGSNLSPARLQIWDCLGENINQKWQFNSDGTLQAANGKCMSVGTTVSNGMLVEAATCNNSDRQKWTYNAYTGRITNKSVDLVTGSGAPKCLDLDSGAININGGKVQMWECASSPNMQFAMQELTSKFITNLNQTAAENAAKFALNIENGALVMSASQPGWHSAQWTFQRNGNLYRMANKWKSNQFVNFENFNLKASTIDLGWHSAMWILRQRPEKAGEVYTIQNYWTNQYLVYRNGTLQVAAFDPNSTADLSGYWSFGNSL